jgi:regulator of sigma E protease
LTTLLAFLFVLGVLIFVHELGHFLAARRHGVRVLTFSLGFGPKILKVKRGDTEYCVSAVPLGGYVKMAGENPEDPRSGQPDEFLSKTKWQRFQILFAGPAMNILLAVVVTAIVLGIQGVRQPVFLDGPALIGSVAPGSPAEKAGLMRGDRVITISGDQIATWKDLELAIGLRRPNRDMSVTVLRDGQNLTTNVVPVAEGRYEVSDIGVYPDANPVVLRVLPGDRAEQAGFKAGDIILSVNGERMATRMQLIAVISQSANKTIAVTVRRDGADQTISATPDKCADVPGCPGQDRTRGWLGVELSEQMKSFQPGPFEAIRLSVVHNIESSGIIFRTLAGLFTGETSVRQLQGPVGIAQLSGESAQEGFITLLSLMAMLSINLGILNLMPVPVLDGGHILIMALEGIARRDFSMQVKEKMLLAGFVVLMMLMVTVIYNDLTRISWIERLMPWRN